MTAQLLDYASYSPAYRLARSEIAAATTGPAAGARGTRSVAGFDEDVISMAVAAVRRLGPQRSACEHLYLGSSSFPYADKSSALTVHAASGLSDRAFCIDLHGIRGGVAALRAAATTGGVAVVSDLRTGRSGSVEESESGDGAAAFLFGKGANPAAEVLATSSVPYELMDVWRAPGSPFTSTGEDRFVAHVLEKAVRDAVVDAQKISGLTEPATLALVATANRRLAIALSASLSASGDTEVLTTHRDSLGYCGSADAGLLLAQGLDRARAGDTVLLVAATGGADVMLLRKLVDGAAAQSADDAGTPVRYHQYLTWRGLVEREPARRPPRPGPAPPAAHRDVAWKYGLVGVRCTACHKVYLPPERVCQCGAVDQWSAFPVADLIGTVVTHTTDAVSDSPNPPAMAALVDFGDNGRLLLEVTDATPADVTVGSRIEMTFRRTYSTGGVPNYFWKGRPHAGSAP